jgi:hypothetical protein
MVWLDWLLNMFRGKKPVLQVKRRPLQLSGTPDTAMDEDVAEAGWALTVSGGIAPYAAELFSGHPIAGLTPVGGSSPAFTINAGTPTEAGEFPGNVIRVTDARGTVTDFASFTVVVTGIAAPDITAGMALSITNDTADAFRVAPLAMFVDGTETVAAGITSVPFHELHYTWDFGDPGGDPWDYGVNTDRNVAYGPVAAHVYESPGTYTITLDVTDGSETAQTQDSITVTDPATIFPTTQTILVSNGSITAQDAIDAGCTGATRVESATNLNTVMTSHMAANRRILFKRGDTFTFSATVNIGNSGPGIVGAWGSGAAPIFQCSAAGTFSGRLFQPQTNVTRHWRFMDFEIDRNTNLPTPIRIEPGVTDILMQRVVMDGPNGTMATSSGSLALPVRYRIFMVDCQFTNHAGTGNFVFWHSLYDSAIIGCTLDNNVSGEHLIRLQYGRKVVISNNYCKSPGVNFGGKGCITVRGPESYDALLAFPAESGHSTQYIVVSDNVLIADTAVSGPGGFAPKGRGSNEWVHDCIYERNHVTISDRPMILWSHNVTIRNNIFVRTGNSDTEIISVNSDELNVLSSIPDNIFIYNNTFYSPSVTASGAYVIELVPSGTPNSGTIGTVYASNNLVYIPNGTGTPTLSFVSIGTLTAANNSTNAEVLTNPSWVSGTPAAFADYALGAGSYALGDGSLKLRALFDANMVERGATPDLGAIERV